MASSSAAALSHKGREVAERKLERAYDAFSRINHSPAGKLQTFRAMACRICLFRAFRVTDDFACRLGTTLPNQCPSKNLSTMSLPELGNGVDNFPFAAAHLGLIGPDGHVPT